MKQKILIGMACMEEGWRRILQQEGIAFKKAGLEKKTAKEEFAAIILNSALKKKQVQNLLSFISAGGTLLATPQHIGQILPELKFQMQRQNPICPKGKFFYGAGMLWLNQQIAVFKGIQPGQPFEKRIGKGLLLALPFDPDSAVLEEGFEKRAFFSEKAKPAEFASKTSKAAVRALVRNCLLRLFEFREIPFVHLWYYPKNYASVLCFHVDLDFIDSDTLKAILLFNSLGMQPVWFVNLQVAENCDKHILGAILRQRFLGQHAYVHDYWADEAKAMRNTLSGHNKAEALGFSPKCFSAPNGVWNSGIAMALDAKGYDFAIGFSLDNDNLPFNPILSGRAIKTIFIPTHPVGIGLLKQYDFNEKQLMQYFLAVIERNSKANLPIMLYSHPFKEIGRFPTVIEGIVEKIKSDNAIWLANYFQFASWWRKRQRCTFSIEFDGRALAIKAKCHPNASFRIVKSGKQFFLPARSQRIALGKLVRDDEIFTGFLQDTTEKASGFGKKFLAKRAAGKAIRFFR